MDKAAVWIGSATFVLILLFCSGCPFEPPPGSFTPRADFTVNGAASASTFEDAVLDASTSFDPTNGILLYRWDFEDTGDGVFDTDYTTNPTGSHRYELAGAYLVTLQVYNSADLTDTTTKQITVASSEIPQAIFSFSPENPDAGDEVTFDAADSTDDDTESADLQVRWDFEDDGTFDVDWSTDKTTSYAYSSQGIVTARLEVKDQWDLVGATTADLNIGGSQPPTAAFVYSPPAPVMGEPVDFDASGSTDDDTDSADLQVRWDFDNDGTYELDWTTTKTAQHTYSVVGTYTVRLDVRDSDQTVGSTTGTVSIDDQPVYLLETTALWTDQGEDIACDFGTYLEAGDFNGDEHTDLIVGAYTYNSQVGKVYLYTNNGSGFGDTSDWSAIGDDQSGSQLGGLLAAGDFNNDGYDDVVVVAAVFDTTNGDAGKVYVYEGSATGPAAGYSWSSSGDDQATAHYGYGVATGDVNADGYDDLAVGAMWYTTSNSRAGKAYLYLGGATGLDTSPHWESTGDDGANHNFGEAMVFLDANGDGHDDLLVSSNMEHDGVTVGTGKTFLYLGSSSGLSITADWSATGDGVSGAAFGFTVSAGDLNGDAYDDALVVARLQDSNTGKAFGYAGGPSGLQSAPFWTSDGEGQSGQYLTFAKAPGDINNDGMPDVLIVASYYGTNHTGLIALYLGNGTSFETSAAWQSSGDDIDNGGFGFPLVLDADSDGHNDLAAGARDYYADHGKIFLFLNEPQ